MKLAEALIIQRNLQQKIEQSKHRLTSLIQLQEGDKPQEDPQILFKELEITFSQLTDITKKINYTNYRTGLGSMTLAEALTEMDILSLKYQVYDDIFMNLSNNLANSEDCLNNFKFYDLKIQRDKLLMQHRELESKIKETTWKIDLIEKW